ncbi:hypothetical protein NQ272_27870, partial [Escherichia coli]|nr:hypothetical protein [Escherichia coli]
MPESVCKNEMLQGTIEERREEDPLPEKRVVILPRDQGIQGMIIMQLKLNQNTLLIMLFLVRLLQFL